jgi:polyferredoxin
LLVFDADQKLNGIAIRHSYDTPSHVEDVVKDYHFMEQWNGKTRGEISGMQGWKPSRFHIVSGASRTSEAVVASVTLRSAIGEQSVDLKPALQYRWQDVALMLFTVAGLLLTFAKWPWLQRRKLWIHILMVLYIGLISGDLLAQSLLVSWAGHGIPWQQLSGLVFLAAVSFLIPWSTGKPTYCTHICPHGHVQRWLMKIVPARKKVHLATDEKWSFSALPGLLLITILIVTFLNLPIDLAGFEPFDAWSLKGVGIATVSVAIISLLFSLFVPMGYCRYGCPTGFALELVKRGRKSGFRKKDWWLAAMVATALVLYFADS